MMNNSNSELQNLLEGVQKSQVHLASSTLEERNDALKHLHKIISSGSNEILNANTKDIEAAKQIELPKNMVDRLLLNPERIEGILDGIQNVIDLPDPLNQILEKRFNKANGLHLSRVSTTIGIIGIIYESRPNVTIDAAILGIKSGNGCFLKCGWDSINTSRTLANMVTQALAHINHDLKHCVTLLNANSQSELRTLTGAVLKQDNVIDLIIPRGGKGLIEFVSQNTTIPTLKHLDGNCHTYVDKDANLEDALRIVLNAKMRRTSICSATESLVVHSAVASHFLPELAKQLSEAGCEIVGCEMSVRESNIITRCTDEDYYKEFLSAKISVKVVNSLQEAISHVNKYSSGHTDCIISRNQENADLFSKMVNSAVVMHNTSTQFCDGFEFGLGSEIGISTGKIHARGPVGLTGLTTYKWLVSSVNATRP